MAPVNDPPSFTPGTESVESRMGDGQVSVPWASGISAGPANESWQVVSFDIVSVDTGGVPEIFDVPPAIDSAGMLTFTTGSEPGSAWVTVRAHDDGGLEDYGLAPGSIVPPGDTSDEVTFAITVREPLPAPPVAEDDVLVVDEDGFGQVDVLRNDHDVNRDPLTVVDVGPAAKGTVSFYAPADFEYVPDRDATGADAATYTISDGHGGTDTATVHITIEPVNDAPVAMDDAATVAEGSAGTPIPVLANDGDVDGDALAVTAALDAAHGTVSLDAGGVVYVPSPGYAGPDAFDYVVDDGSGGTAAATVTVTVAPDVIAPQFTGLTRSIPSQAIGRRTVRVRLAWTATDAGSGVAQLELVESVNGGTWHAVALPTPTSTWLERTVTIGSGYRYQVRATDGRGNTSAYRAWSAFTPHRRQETNAAVTWHGTWLRATDWRLSGGASRRTSGTGRVTFTFTGRSVGWVATRSPKGGRAQVRIDGVLVATLSLRTDSTRFRGIVYRTDLTVGSHRIEIRPLGDGTVDVDAFVVIP
ncbi:MAG: hypothetical protein A2V85_12165 [Chloroflexi bacterium RBG_16_72_14]|nr:MAG: hypothetical protein A2V85_12165 [Chloroflexi bacterium RBG_16_72_14]